MNSKVKVTADAIGNVVIPSKNNADWGHIRVQQERIVIDERGIARKKTVSALIPGLINDLKSFGWKAVLQLLTTCCFHTLRNSLALLCTFIMRLRFSQCITLISS